MESPKTLAPHDDPRNDKKGADLDKQRFAMLESIARELSSDIVFPTCFDSVVRIRKALDDPNLNLQRIAKTVALDPLVAARILALGNSALYSAGGAPLTSVAAAIERIGLQNVRSVAIAIATKGLLMTRQVAAFSEMSKKLWQHSLRAAAAAYVLARRKTKVSPDEALLAGMIHDIGAFYMIYRAAQYEELTLRPVSMKYLVMNWHEDIGHSVALAIGLPEVLADSLLAHEPLRPIPDPPKNLADIVYTANLLAGGSFFWLGIPVELVASHIEVLTRFNAELSEEIKACEQSLVSAMG